MNRTSFEKIKNNRFFQAFVISAIILSAFLVGVSTYNIPPQAIVFRVLRLISAIPELKELIEALLKSIKRVFYVSLLLFIIIYVYASFGSILFGQSDPQRWGDLGISMITLVQVLTLSSWENVMLPMQEKFWWAWIYFYSFVAIGSITILNLIIAVLVDVITKQK